MTDKISLSTAQAKLLKALRAENDGTGTAWCQIYRNEVRSARVLEKKGLVEISHARLFDQSHYYEAKAVA